MSLSFRTYVQWEDGFECHEPRTTNLITEQRRVIVYMLDQGIQNFRMLTCIDGGKSNKGTE